MEHEHEHDQLHTPEEAHTHEHEHLHEHEHSHDGEHVHSHEHEHTHSHEHTHEHTHADGTVHSHAHTHTHTHAHSHEHTHGDAEGFDSMEQAMALMGYMLDHNRHHAEELHELCHKLEASGKEEAAALIHDAVDKFGEGNALLESALEKMKQE